MANRFHPHTESVWSYPRPPRIEPSDESLEVWLGGTLLAQSSSALRVLETSHPPVYYLPLEDFVSGALHPVPGRTFCEFKGAASYYDVVAGGHRAARAAWAYPHPAPGYEELADTAALYPGLMDSVRVDGEEVQPQDGDFYGGWITSRVTGPFKGPPGTWGW
ncbi:DUF427 domain-containing protein [Arthrobacter sp. Helios]|uniref:DUF427 domain-containing protein n=1 Tax=Arthrobacter sp. Helios TaxID=2828862 RepID=UPI00204C1626|nr:DUF427 domain-containing protein [Arthrobacter sp. Helios]UPO76769.1 DUF427 domain-containing protein [Arthrobacter sp. Helios]